MFFGEIKPWRHKRVIQERTYRYMQLFQKAILCSIIFTSTVFSQEGETVVIRDLESWNSLSVKFKASKKFHIGLEQGLRLNSARSEIHQN